MIYWGFFKTKAHICSNDGNITTTRYSLEKKIQMPTNPFDGF